MVATVAAASRSANSQLMCRSHSPIRRRSSAVKEWFMHTSFARSLGGPNARARPGLVTLAVERRRETRHPLTVTTPNSPLQRLVGQRHGTRSLSWLWAGASSDWPRLKPAVQHSMLEVLRHSRFQLSDVAQHVHKVVAEIFRVGH